MNTGSFELFRNLNTKNLYRGIRRPIVIADQIRTPENMGSILRLSGNIGVQKALFISDITDSFKQYKINKTASGAAEKVDWQIIGKNELVNHIPDNYTLLAIETTDDAISLFDFTFPDDVAFLVGNEVKGISEDLLQRADKKLFIPVPGNISSLNVSHALSVVLFEWLRQKMDKLST